MKPIKFKIQSNIDDAEIDRFISFYRTRENDFGTIFIEFIDDGSEKVGEVDSLFLCYLLLFLAEDNREVVFIFSESINKDRIYSIQHQIEHLIYTLKVFLNDVPKIKLHTYQLDIETEEIHIDESRNYLRSSELSQSGKFIPPIFINNNIDEYFASDKTSIKLEKLQKIYLNGVLNEIYERTRLSKYEANKKLNISNLNFIELCIFRLLLSDNSFRLLGKEGGGRVEDDLKQKYIRENLDKTHYFIKYAQQLSKGLKELALNITEHPSIKKGVISARIYEKSRIGLLKNIQDEFLEKYNSSDLFLDINVVDLGDESIRNKYIKNIKDNKDSLGTHNRLKINFDKDIETLNDSTKYFFSDFFIPNPKTDHQLNKLISRYGIQYFNHIILHRFDGYVKIISHSENVILFNNGTKTHELSNFEKVRYGTSYNCIIPLSRFQDYYYEVDKSNFNKNKTGPSDNSINTIDKHQIIKLSEINEKSNKNDIILFNSSIDKVEGKYDNILSIYNEFLKIHKKYWKHIYLINANDFEISNSSSWLRLLSAVTIDFKNIIIYNIPKEITKDIIGIRSSQSKFSGFNFWDDDSYVLFYSYQKSKENEFGRFGANILSGKTETKFNYLNLLIWKHHYSFYNGFIAQNINDNTENHEFSISSPLFTENSLKYFELIISNQDKSGGIITLFEQSLQYALNKNLETNLYADTNNKGYKITKTHFRLGSKIHIEDFYYAKRVFHNSFFTTPLAYLLSDYLANYIEDNPSIEELSLVGYESYSDFLVSTVRSLLSKRFKNLRISHATYINGEELNRPLNSIHKNIFIIVPIASSFSTSIKIKNDLLAIFARNIETKNIKFDFHEPHLNLILVGNTDFDKTDSSNGDEDGFIDFHQETLISYGWLSINKKKKLIRINSYQNKTESKDPKIDQVLQKYFIPVYTNWHKSNNCDFCFPTSILDERCLIETGPASITPQLIFGMPKIRPNIRDNKILNLNGSLLYGNLKKGENRYLYFARIGDIINKKEIKNGQERFANKENIKRWLEEIKEKHFNTQHLRNKKIVLVTPSYGSKSNFIDLVNEIVFGYTANCLTISLKEEYIENAHSLYGDGIYKSDIIIYVDDVLSTINSFIETNYVIKHIKNKLDSGKGIDYCISLINRMSYDSEENLLLKLLPLVNNDCYDIINTIENSKTIQKELCKQKVEDIVQLERKIINNQNRLDLLCNELFQTKIQFGDTEERLLYYCKINNPSIEEPNKLFPLDKESDRYKSLSETSSLDSIRYLFILKRNKLQEIDLSEKIQYEKLQKIDDTKIFQNKKLFQLLVLDAFYSLFEFDNKAQAYKYSSDLNLFFPEKRVTSDRLDSFYLLKSKLESKLFDENRLVYKIHKDILDRYRHNLDYVILKIICSTPLIYYKRIREVSFDWVLTMLEELRTGRNSKGHQIDGIIGIDNLTEANIIDYFEVNAYKYYSELQKLKFLLKKAVQLKSNYIIHPIFLNSLKNLIGRLYDEKDSILKIKSDSDNKFKSKATQLLKSESSMLIEKTHNYLKTLNEGNLFKDNFLGSLLKDDQKSNSKIEDKFDIQMSFFQDENKKKDEIEQKLVELKLFSKYRLTTSKKFIYEIISLIQELILEHETKAVKLEENINAIVVDNSNDTVNGDFNHFLRLLKLENTAAIKLFWEYFINKEQRTLKYYTLNEIKNSLSKYQIDPKYIFIKELILDDDNFSHFIALRANLHKWQNHFEDSGKSLTGKVKEILKFSSKIIGGEVEAFFTINYKNLKNPSVNDVFVFEKYASHLRKSNFNIDSLDNLEKSITYKMFEGITENVYPDLPLSNFEVYKSKTENIPKHRKDVLFGTDVGFSASIATECNFNGISDAYDVLFIRISDFVDNNFYPERIRGKIDTNPVLYTQGVLTFYIKNRDSRVDEKSLRLLLLLRNPISEFVKSQITESQLIELFDNKELKKYQKHMKHGIGKFISYQEEIIQDYENIKQKIHDRNDISDQELRLHFEEEYIRKGSRNFNEFRIINKSIGSQIGVITQKFEGKNILSYDYFIGMLDTIYKSSKIGYREIGYLNYKVEIVFVNNFKFQNISIPDVYINSIFPEIMINQKKYGKSRKINWIESDKSLEFVFSNEVNEYGKGNIEGFGTKMCDEIGSLHENIKILTSKNRKNNTYIVNIKILKP